MSRRLRLENGEAFVISVTPVPRGLVAPVVVLVVLEGLIVWLATRWGVVHRHEGLAVVIIGALPALVVVTRSWRWRSHKVTLTTQRIVSHGGVLARYSSQVNLGDVVATRADQSFVDRLRRRGVVTVETPTGSVTLGALRHPAAFRRLVDRTRRDAADAVSRSWDDWFNNPDIDAD